MKLLLIFAAVFSVATAQAEPESASDPMSGSWTVDLRLDLGDQPYGQPMILEIGEDNTVEGVFYGADIESGQAGEAQGRRCIAFRTRDGSGPYQHAACLVGAVLVGQSWSEGRGFLLPWTATKDN